MNGRANYQFKVGRDILINQRKHHRNQLGRVVALAPTAVGPYTIKRQITQNTFEVDSPAAVRKKMRPVFRKTTAFEPHYARPARSSPTTAPFYPQPTSSTPSVS